MLINSNTAEKILNTMLVLFLILRKFGLVRTYFLPSEESIPCYFHEADIRSKEQQTKDLHFQSKFPSSNHSSTPHCSNIISCDYLQELVGTPTTGVLVQGIVKIEVVIWICIA